MTLDIVHHNPNDDLLWSLRALDMLDEIFQLFFS